MTTVRVGIVGLGYMGQLHMRNCLFLENVQVVGAADTSKRSLAKAHASGIKNLYRSYQKLFKDSSLDLDAVIIALPNFLHLESVQLALESGLDVFVEKPMANTSEECRKMITLEKKYGRKIMVGHYCRFISYVEQMKKTVDKGTIGELEVMTSEMITNGPFTERSPSIPTPVPEWWFTAEKTGGGVLIDSGPHLLDLFRFFNGDAEVKYSYLSHKFNLPVEDGAIILLNSVESSTRGIINLGWFQKAGFSQFNFRVVLHGSAGFLTSDHRPGPYLHAVKEGTKNILRRLAGRDIHPLAYSETLEAYYKEMEHFCDCIRTDNKPMVSSIDGLKTIEMIETIYDKLPRRPY